MADASNNKVQEEQEDENAATAVDLETVSPTVEPSSEQSVEPDAKAISSLAEHVPKLTPYNHTQAQEIARKRIAFTLLGILAGILVFSFVYLWVLPLSKNTRQYVDNLILLLQLVFGPVITLTGTAVGYYFGANSNSSGPK